MLIDGVIALAHRRTAYLCTLFSSGTQSNREGAGAAPKAKVIRHRELQADTQAKGFSGFASQVSSW